MLGNWKCFNVFAFQNVSISVVGGKRDFTIYEDEGVDTYLELIAGEERRGGAGRDEEAPPAAADEASGNAS